MEKGDNWERSRCVDISCERYAHEGIECTRVISPQRLTDRVGIWVTLPDEQSPSITLVGSSNYTKRSYSLDLEINALVVTDDESLKKQLQAEVEWLQEKSNKVTLEDFERTERRVSLKVRLALWLVGVLGGQL